MRNLKKILALVLALVMSMSLMATANAFTDDKDVDAAYDEAATVLANLKVFEGYTDGSFNPKGNITRAEVAAIIYRIATGDVSKKSVALYSEAATAEFSDVKSTDWHAGYIGYCYNAKYISGYGNGKFGPNDPVTGYQALAMILRAVGYGKNGEFQGASWAIETAKYANMLELTKNIIPGTLGQPATREVVAELLFRAMLVPQVSWTNMGGYSDVSMVASDNWVNNWWFQGVTLEKNPSLGFANFGLRLVEGEITGTTYKKGITYIGNRTVNNTPADWTDIGYLASVYVVPGAKSTFDAVSDVTVWDTSLGNSTNGTAYENATVALTTGVYAQYALDTYVEYYYNGELADNAIKVAAAKAAADTKGVKVDFLDNDDNGKADVVVVTEYTYAMVDGIANEVNAGGNAVQPKSYYLRDLHDDLSANGRVAVKVADLVCDEELAMNTRVTYVAYAGDWYVTVAPLTTDTFTRINYAQVGGSAISYVIGGADYEASDKANSIVALNNGNVPSSMDIYTDPYGYILHAEKTAVATNYAYVITNNHSTPTTGLTNTRFAFADGSVTLGDVVKATRADGVVYPTGDNDLVHNELYQNIYTYTTNDAGYYTLVHTGVDFTTGTLTNNRGTATLGSTNLYVNNKTIVVDLRAVLAGTASAGTVYTGYAEIPSVVNAKGSYVAVNGTLSLVFLTGGNNLADAAEFIVYKTTANYYTTNEAGVANFYYLDVLKDGVVVPNYELTAAQYQIVTAVGAARYQKDALGNLVPFAFDEPVPTTHDAWVNVTWGNGIVTDQTNGRTYTYGDGVTFNVIDVKNSSVAGYSMITGSDTTSAKAHIVYDPITMVAKHIYIIVGELTVADTSSYTNQVYNKPAGTTLSGVAYAAKSFYRDAGKITVTSASGISSIDLAQAAAINKMKADLAAAINLAANQAGKKINGTNALTDTATNFTATTVPYTGTLSNLIATWSGSIEGMSTDALLTAFVAGIESKYTDVATKYVAARNSDPASIQNVAGAGAIDNATKPQWEAYMKSMPDGLYLYDSDATLQQNVDVNPADGFTAQDVLVIKFQTPRANTNVKLTIKDSAGTTWVEQTDTFALPGDHFYTQLCTMTGTPNPSFNWSAQNGYQQSTAMTAGTYTVTVAETTGSVLFTGTFTIG